MGAFVLTPSAELSAVRDISSFYWASVFTGQAGNRHWEMVFDKM